MGICILLILNILIVVNSVKRIWLIRHCDKPSDKNDPCCSDYGYKHADNWYKYFEKYINSTPYMYAANYYEKQAQCTTNYNYNYNYASNSDCQKSQRMYLTAYAINKSIRFSKDDINIDYCTGQYKDLAKSTRDVINHDIIVVWEHSEIVDIINYFGIKLSSWPNSVDDDYSIVLMIDVDNNKLYYDCYQWEDEYIDCSNDAIKWLNKYKTITEYYEDKKYKTYLLSNSNLNLQNTYQEYNTTIKIGFILLINLFFVCLFLFLKKQYEIRNVIGRKYKYIVIPETQILTNKSIYNPSYCSINDSK